MRRIGRADSTQVKSQKAEVKSATSQDARWRGGGISRKRTSAFCLLPSDLHERQADREAGAAAFFALDADRAVVRLDNRFGDVEAEAEAAVVAAGNVAGAVEALEKFRDLV